VAQAGRAAFRAAVVAPARRLRERTALIYAIKEFCRRGPSVAHEEDDAAIALTTSAHQTLDRLGLEWIVSMTPLGNAVSTGGGFGHLGAASSRLRAVCGKRRPSFGHQNTVWAGSGVRNDSHRPFRYGVRRHLLDVAQGISAMAYAA
jgi:hypothetical protein